MDTYRTFRVTNTALRVHSPRRVAAMTPSPLTGVTQQPQIAQPQPETARSRGPEKQRRKSVLLDDVVAFDWSIAGSSRGGVGGVGVRAADPLDTDAVAAPCFGYACCGTRVYGRRALTPADLLDSSEALRAASAISLFTGGDAVRASQSHFVQANWLLVSLLACAVALPHAFGGDDRATASFAGAAAASVVCAAAAAYQIIQQPDALSRVWLLPVRLHILALAVATAFCGAVAGGGGALAIVVAVLALALLPHLAVAFVASMLAGAREEKAAGDVFAETSVESAMRYALTVHIQLHSFSPRRSRRRLL